MKRGLLLVGGALLAGAVVWGLVLDPITSAAETEEQPEQSADIVAVKMPATLSDTAKMGQTVFRAKCSVCHGSNAQGVNGSGPPLVHKIYEPSHHGDAAFFRAAEFGVRAHHWPFGNMAAIKGVTRADISVVIAYVRELQRENGIR